MASKQTAFFGVGEIRPAEDSDFEHFIELADGAGWTKKTDKNGLMVWTRNMENTSIKMFKLRITFSDVSAATAFDVLMDPVYRITWDDAAIRDYDICKLDGYNDIGYYAMKCPAPLKNRDFVNQRSWRVRPREEYIVFNHSVSHKKEPPSRYFIRAVSYITGFVIRPSGQGSVLTYITQSDPKGKIPKWAINFALYKVAPKLLQKLHTASIKYNDWKASNKPEFKPWLNPDQNPLPLFSAGVQGAPCHTEALTSQGDEEEVESWQDLDTVPEGMEQYQTMDTDEEIVTAINGVSFDCC